MTSSRDWVTESGSQNLPSATVIVCTRNRPDALRSCLASLQSVDYPEVNVVVIDNAPQDEAAKLVAAEFKVAYAVEPIPGLSRARNRGLRSSTSEIVAFTDDDCRVDGKWLKELAVEFDDATVACVTGAVKPFEVTTIDQQTLEESSRRAKQTAGRAIYCNTDNGWFQKVHSLAAGSGANMAFRRDFLVDNGGFDETLGAGTPAAGGEENLAFFSVVKTGCKLVHTPEAVVYHGYPEQVPDLRRKMLESMTAQTAYLARLSLFEKGYRLKALRLAFAQVAKYVRASRNDGGQMGGRAGITLVDEIRALAAGPWRYLTSRRQAARIHARLAGERNK